MSAMSSEQARELARRAVELTAADQAEAIVSANESSLTRFARNRIHQNVLEINVQVAVRAVLGTRTGTASTNRIDEDGLRACCEAAVAAATASPEDPGFPGLPAPAGASGEHADRIDPATKTFAAAERAGAVRSIVTQSSSRGLEAAGTISASVESVTIANSLGIDTGMATSSVRATVLSSADPGAAAGSGWASYYSAGPGGLDPVALGDQAATLAERSVRPGTLDPGSYTVVLAPEAVADILDFLGYAGFSARAVEEGRSFMSGKLGERIVSEMISITDDALASDAFGLTFDLEGVPKRTVPLIADGVAIGPVTDSYWAAKTGRENTGHALPAPNPHGPLPLDLQISPGDATIDELVSSVSRGVYVTRFHYVNIEDPIPVTLTGMTRDGTFLIENGSLTTPLKNLRFTQSAIAALGAVAGVTRDRAFFDAMLGSALAPGLLIEGWNFTGQTE